MNVIILRDGVSLTGWEPELDLFATRWNLPTTAVECLESSSKWQRRAIVSRPFSAEEKETASTLWEETMSEVELGILES